MFLFSISFLQRKAPSVSILHYVRCLKVFISGILSEVINLLWISDDSALYFSLFLWFRGVVLTEIHFEVAPSNG